MFIFSRSVVRLRRCVVILNVVNNFIIREEEKQATCTKKISAQNGGTKPLLLILLRPVCKLWSLFQNTLQITCVLLLPCRRLLAIKGSVSLHNLTPRSNFFIRNVVVSVLRGDIVGNETFSSQRLLKKSQREKNLRPEYIFGRPSTEHLPSDM